MKKVAFILALGLVGLAIQAQPQFNFEEETIDYGEIENGSDGVRTFKFTNTGDEPLVIEDIKTTCGCTVPQWTKEAVLPGVSGEIQVKYNTKKVGPIRRTITVYSNADEPTKSLKIKGKVLN